MYLVKSLTKKKKLLCSYKNFLLVISEDLKTNKQKTPQCTRTSLNKTYLKVIKMTYLIL